ncbi:Aste57867_12460 [Aphanomyces stellatus]|uniref:Aste57867_12460 protein n=1 Tax=Aphanomyces stellatus TaxID=120398 RepID=A0A485KXL2_9STRA|nr:hypothetical protein As57867_012414 [Aphanomyces stellatus]VFT89311.1 Aste57867_12460 [Aphanomyces stellatus]
MDTKPIALRAALAGLVLLLPEFICGRVSHVHANVIPHRPQPTTPTFHLRQLVFITPQLVSIMLVFVHIRIVWKNYHRRVRIYLKLALLSSLVSLSTALLQSGFRASMRWCCVAPFSWYELPALFLSSRRSPTTPVVQPVRCTPAFGTAWRFVLVALHFAGTFVCFVAVALVVCSNV